MKLDIYNHKERWEKWKDEIATTGYIEGVGKTSVDWILRFTRDMEIGQNVARSARKGARSYTRLNTIRIRMTFLARQLELRGVKDISRVKAEDLHQLFGDMRSGKLQKLAGGEYKSVANYVKVFKSFWHWLQRVLRKEGRHIEDVTIDLDTTDEPSDFVCFTKEDLDMLLPYFSQDEQVRMLVMFDTIVRSPTELMNLKASDLSKDFKEITIREETAKTYGRTVKLLLSSEALREHVERHEFADDAFLFSFSPPLFNRKLKQVAGQVLGARMTKGGQRYSELNMYDFRHSGAIHWRLGAYRTKIDALMYRGGWENLETLNYYTRKIGMRDSIEKDDLLVGVDKTEIEKKLSQQDADLEAALRRIAALENQLAESRPLSIILEKDEWARRAVKKAHSKYILKNPVRSTGYKNKNSDIQLNSI